jgi:predicted ATPase
MSKIKIKNFGPIKEGYQENDGWIDIKKVTVFIGNQGSGKSTVAKLISTFTWIEKALVRGDYTKKWFERKNKLQNQYLNYHRLKNYFKTHEVENTLIEYQGDAYSIKYENGSLIIDEISNKAYPLPQIMYVPAERNFITYVKTPKELKLSSESLKEFLTEFDNAKNEMKGLMKLPINDVDLEYDKLNDTLNLKGEGYKVKLTEASSGFQSLVPLYLVSWFLANTINRKTEGSPPAMTTDEIERFKKGLKTVFDDKTLTDEQRRAAISVLSSKFNKSAFINIVEEPEQNLYPDSQRQILNSLLKFNNMNEGNKLILTTHSPYLINYLTLAVKADSLIDMSMNYKGEGNFKAALSKIVPFDSVVRATDLVIYELDDKGNIIKLGDYNGIPSDDNYLNEKMAEGNELFGKLLDLEELCQ